MKIKSNISSVPPSQLRFGLIPSWTLDELDADASHYSPESTTAKINNPIQGSSLSCPNQNSAQLKLVFKYSMPNATHRLSGKSANNHISVALTDVIFTAIHKHSICTLDLQTVYAYSPSHDPFAVRQLLLRQISISYKTDSVSSFNHLLSLFLHYISHPSRSHWPTNASLGLSSWKRLLTSKVLD